MGLKDIRTRANHVYEKLDEWIVENTYNRNDSLRQIKDHIRNVVNETTDKLSPELRFWFKHITSEDEINFISTDKPYIDGMLREKLSEN